MGSAIKKMKDVVRTKDNLFLAIVGLLCSFLTACSPHYNGVGKSHDMQDESIASWHFCDVDEAEIDRIMGQMTLKEKIAQMYIVGVTVFPWFDLYEPEFFIKNLGVGGVFVRPMSGVGF